MADVEAERKEKEKKARREKMEASRKELEAKLASGEISRPKIPVIEPHINASIWPTEDGKWIMGNLMLCERLSEGTEAPSDAIVTWQDSKGVAYCLRPRKDSNPVPPYDPANAPLIPRHFTSAIFEIGTDVLVKVRWAPEGWARTEGDAIRLVRDKAPEVPVPEAIHYWYDKEWTRYFLILRRVHGQTLDKIWFTLSERDKKDVCYQIARHIRQTATITSPIFQHPDGEPLGDFHLMHAEGLTGMWDPVYGGCPGPFSSSDFREYLKETSDGVEPPKYEPQFQLYQGDPTPGNIIITGAETSNAAKPDSLGQVHVAGIIDWERAGFYPDFWSLLHPYVPVSGFELSLTMEQMEDDPAQTNQYSHNLIRGLAFCDGADHGARFIALAEWWKKFDAGRMRFLQKKAQERFKAEAAKEPSGE